MKILFLDWACFHKEETLNALKKMGHEPIRFIYDGYNDLNNDDFVSTLLKKIDDCAPEAVFSYNYFPLVAECCKLREVPYISFVYDSPYVYIYSYTLMYPTNHVFLFDSSWVEEFRLGGLKNVHYMILPGNADKIASIKSVFHDQNRTKCDVSFVGALYNEQHNFYERLEEKASQYLLGYLSGIMEAQQKLYGMNIIESSLTEDIIELLTEAIPVGEDPMAVEPRGYRYANYFIKRKVTQMERIRLLTALGKRFGSEYDLRIFTLDPEFRVPGIKNMGVSPYETEMPFVFNESKINLNISLRSITAGIPLRCMDIMSAGGFLLSNYQKDLVCDFIPGEDFDFFGDPEDMMEKVEYYLSHDKERTQIAENGREKIKKMYSFEAVFDRIFEIVFGDFNG